MKKSYTPEERQNVFEAYENNKCSAQAVLEVFGIDAESFPKNSIQEHQYLEIKVEHARRNVEALTRLYTSLDTGELLDQVKKSLKSNISVMDEVSKL